MKDKWKDLWRKLRSMRWQVFSVVFFVGFIPVLAFSTIMIRSYNDQIISQRTDELRSYGNMISNLVITSDYLYGKESVNVDEEVE